MKTITNTCTILSAALLLVLALCWVDICASNTSPDRAPSAHNPLCIVLELLDSTRAD